MNLEVITNLQNRVSDMEQVLKDIQKSVHSIEIDNQLKLKANQKISPGIACKIAYDINGLVINGESLKASDIPLLQIDGIEGLRKIIEGKANTSDLSQMILKSSVQSKSASGQVVGTGTKVNFDNTGSIVSVSDLNVNDIPELPIDHIEGLREEIDIVKASIIPSSNNVKSSEITPGTYTKITYDSLGRVLYGSRLMIDDIPMELISKVNMIESKVPMLAAQTSVDSLVKEVQSKIESNSEILPGTYTKVTVDSKGLVTKGSTLTVKDLPELRIDNIRELSTILRGKAEQSDIVSLNETVSGLVTSIAKIGDITNIQNTLKMKANDSDVKELAIKFDSLQRLMDILSVKIPNELIMEQLLQIQTEISTMAGKITVLEKKMRIDEALNTENQ